MAMVDEIPPKPHQYLPPRKPPLRTDADRRRFGIGMIAFGVVFFVGSFVYVKQGTTMTGGQAFGATFPLFLIFCAFGGAIWKQGAEGIKPMVAYLSAAVGLCGFVAYWFWGK